MSDVPDGSWDLPPRIAADITAAYLGELLAGSSHRIGPGETAPAVHLRVASRALFVEALHRRAPQVTRELTGETAREIVASGYRALAELFLHPDDGQPWREAERRQGHYVDAWQNRWRLPDAWLHVAAIMTMHRAYDLADQGRAFDGPLVLPGATALAMLADTPPHPLPGIGSYDPRTETIDAAMRRLEVDLRRHLERIAADDRARTDVLDPKVFRTTAAYEWVARFQTLGESKQHIADAEGLEERHVRREIDQVARLAGITLRRQRRGRPPRRTARTVTVG